MDNDYRISEFAPLLAKNNPKKVKEVVRFLEDEMGIPEEFELKDITIEDLTKNGLLKHGPARLLVNGWQGSKSFMKTTNRCVVRGCSETCECDAVLQFFKCKTVEQSRSQDFAKEGGAFFEV